MSNEVGLIQVEFTKAELQQGVTRVLDCLAPLDDMTDLQVLVILQYLCGLMLGSLGAVFPTEPVHPQLLALTVGYVDMKEKREREANENDGQ